MVKPISILNTRMLITITLTVLNVGLKNGRNFSEDISTDRTAFILNEEAVNQMKLNQPIGKQIIFYNIQGKIVGVIKNTNFRSLHYKVLPNAGTTLANYSDISFKYNGIIYVKIAAGKTQDAIAVVENIWKKENPNLPFNIIFWMRQ